MPELAVLVAALIAGTLGAAMLLLITGIRGTVPDPTRPPSRFSGWLGAQRSPLLAARVGGGVVLLVTVLAVTGWPVAAVGAAALVVCWPALVGGSRAEQVHITRLEALDTWTEALRDTTAAHAGLEQAIAATAPGAAPPIRAALLRLAGHLRTRVPLEDALLDLATDLDHSADMIIAALINNVRRRGDGLVQVLSGLAAAGREELDLRRKITAGRAGDRRAVQLMLLIVVAVAAFLVFFSGGSYTAPYATVTGQIVLCVVLGLFTAAFLWIRALTATAAPHRFLPVPGQHLDAAEAQLIATLTGTQRTDRYPGTVGGFTDPAGAPRGTGVQR